MTLKKIGYRNLKEEVLDRTCGEFAWEEAMLLSHDGLRNEDSKSCDNRDCRHERFAGYCSILDNKTLSVNMYLVHLGS